MIFINHAINKIKPSGKFSRQRMTAHIIFSHASYLKADFHWWFCRSASAIVDNVLITVSGFKEMLWMPALTKIARIPESRKALDHRCRCIYFSLAIFIISAINFTAPLFSLAMPATICESRSMPSVSCPKSFEPIDIPSKFERSHLPIKCWTEFHTSRKFLSPNLFLYSNQIPPSFESPYSFLRRPTKRNHRNHIFKLHFLAHL